MHRYGRGMAVPTAPVAAGSLVGGYLVARETGVRPLGGLVLAGAGAWCAREWARTAGPVAAGALVGVYAAGFGASHPLARRIGAWPSVLSVAAASGAASWALADPRAWRRVRRGRHPRVGPGRVRALLRDRARRPRLPAGRPRRRPRALGGL